MGGKGNAIPPSTWILEHGATMNKFNDIKHFKVNKESLSADDSVNREIEEWKVLQNLEYLTYAEMFRRLAV